jgi:hypothetical protein
MGMEMPNRFDIGSLNSMHPVISPIETPGRDPVYLPTPENESS